MHNRAERKSPNLSVRYGTGQSIKTVAERFCVGRSPHLYALVEQRNIHSRG
jgi:hypothetical protein